MSNYELSVIFLYCAACFVIGFLVGRVWYADADNGTSIRRYRHAPRIRDLFGAGTQQ